VDGQAPGEGSGKLRRDDAGGIAERFSLFPIAPLLRGIMSEHDGLVLWGGCLMAVPWRALSWD
jgi:hypothetical protein